MIWMSPVPQDPDSEAGSTETDVSKVRRRRILPKQSLPRVSLVLMTDVLFICCFSCRSDPGANEPKGHASFGGVTHWILQTLPGLTERSTAEWSHVIPISSLVIPRLCDACMWSQRQPSSAVCVLSWVLLFACLHALGVASVCNSVTSVAVVVKETCRCAAVSDRPSCAPCDRLLT